MGREEERREKKGRQRKRNKEEGQKRKMKYSMQLLMTMKLINACSFSAQSIDQSNIFYSMFIVLRQLGIEEEIERGIKKKLFPACQEHQWS